MRKPLKICFALLFLFVSIQAYSWVQNSELKPKITLLSTTSTENSGLLAYLAPIFKARHAIDIHVLAMGTGQAIRAAQNGDGDLLLVHDKTSELEFMRQGYGEKRHQIMYNDFVVVGPKQDPAKVLDLKGIQTVFKALAQKQSLFISRGDNSGTHKAEQRLWRSAGIEPKTLASETYREVGSGMGRTLNIAASLNAYTLVDRGTWLSFKNRQNLKVLAEGDKQLFNQYSVITLNRKNFPHLNHRGAQTFSKWLISPEGQQAIGNFKIAQEELFFPNYQHRIEE